MQLCNTLMPGFGSKSRYRLRLKGKVKGFNWDLVGCVQADSKVVESDWGRQLCGAVAEVVIAQEDKFACKTCRR